MEMTISDCMRDYYMYCVSRKGSSKGRSGNVSYDEYTFYSYAEPIALYLPEHESFLLTNRKYSVTTSKHITILHSYLSYPDVKKILFLPVLALRSQENVDRFVSSAHENLRRMLSARKRGNWYWNEYKRFVSDCKFYCQASNMPLPAIAPKDLLNEEQFTKFIMLKLEGL